MRLLTINSGSSSIKAALYDMGPPETRLLSASVERISLAGSRMSITDGSGAPLLERQTDLPDHELAFRALFDWLQGCPEARMTAVAHRIVQGDARCHAPRFVTAELLADLEALVPLDPEHMPAALAGIAAVRALDPHLPQVLCFDTSFHQAMPPAAKRYALPRELYEAGIMRLGFHGLSYEYILQELRRLDPAAAEGRLIVAHLGNGASMAAIRGGVGIDTSMGFTPLAGLVMGSRCGDVDPGVLLHLLRSRGMTPDELDELLTRQSGLLGVSGISSDMRDLLAREAEDPRAAEAVQLFCYRAKQYAGAYAAALGGLETLVFTAGIGEKSSPIRERICEGMAFLGLRIDPDRNAANAPIISADDSRVTVRVIPTDEALMLARHTRDLISRKADGKKGERDARV
jgi:acetate kinase